VGRAFSGWVVREDDTFADRTDEKSGADDAVSPGFDWELVPGTEGTFLGVVDGLNNKAKLTMKKAYGYKKFRTLEIPLYHTLGNLPEPKFTHRFFDEAKHLLWTFS